MSNPYAGGLGDALKHLLYVEVLHLEQPQRVIDTHAGMLVYKELAEPERASRGMSVLLAQREAAAFRGAKLFDVRGAALLPHPGSTLLAARTLPEASVFAFEVDGETSGLLRRDALLHGLRERVIPEQGDGLVRGPLVLQRLQDASPSSALVFLDPFLIFREEHSPTTALAVFGESQERGLAAVMFFAFNSAARYHHARSILDATLRRGASAHLVREGDLDEAQGPGPLGCGLVVANLERRSCERLDELSHALALVLSTPDTVFVHDCW